MGDKKRSPVEEQRARQQELIELKRKQEEFQENPEAYIPDEVKTEYVQSGKSKIQNFWYYSRYTIIGMLIVALIFTVAVTQCATKTKYDLTIVLYFKRFAMSTMSENVAIIAEEYCQDYNGDGEVEVLVINCAGTDDQRRADPNVGTRLLGQFQNEESIVYLVDLDAFRDLESSFGNDFIYTGMNLPDLDGAAYQLNGTAFDAAFNTVSPNYTNQFDYYIMRRNVGGTALDGKNDVQKHVNNAEQLIRNIMADPFLSNKNSNNTSSSESTESNTLNSTFESSVPLNSKKSK